MSDYKETLKQLQQVSEHLKTSSMMSELASISKSIISPEIASLNQALKEINKRNSLSLISEQIFTDTRAIKVIVENVNKVTLSNSASAMISSFNSTRYDHIIELIRDEFVPIQKQLLTLSRTFAEQVITNQSNLDFIKEKIDDYADENHNKVLLEDRLEFLDDVNQISKMKVRFGVAIKEKYLKWKKRNPILAGVITIVFILTMDIVSDSVNGFVKSGFAKACTVIRDKPSTVGVELNTIDSQDEMVIINDVPYYYKIAYVNQESEECSFGWVSKRNVKRPTKEKER